MAMALPKRRTGTAKQGSRRSHHRVIVPNIVKDSATGGFKINHTAGGSRDHKGRPLEREA
jgi:ribosomal protein L32